MKKTKIVSIILVYILIVGTLAACAGSPGGENAMTEGANPTPSGENTGGGTAEAVSIMNLMAADLLSPGDEGENPATQNAAKGANDFAFKMSALLAEDAGDENLVCSPFSVWLPLAALLNATDEENKVALISALGASDIRVEDINMAASRMLYDLTKLRIAGHMDDYNDPMKIANAIFVGETVTLNRDFAQTFLDYYRGTAMTVDFSSSDAVDKINQWASDNTEGLITDLIQEFDPDTIAAIANAIYYSDRWMQEFDPDETTEGDFEGTTGTTPANFMLREGIASGYFEDDQIQAMPLSFASGGGLYIILPKDKDANNCLSKLDAAYFDEIQTNSIQATGKFMLPRFTIQSGVMDLSGTLTKLGVPLLDREKAPLSGYLIEEDIPVWVGQAVQKAMIDVNEKGTTAAAVTVMGINATSMPIPTAPFEMICDRPFVFVLYDNTFDGGKQVLFTGIVNQIAVG